MASVKEETKGIYMFELHDSQMFMYFADKQGAGQALLLCGSIVIPRKIDIGQMQNAANELCRLNNGLRTYFIEKDGKVFQDIKPFEKRNSKFCTLTVKKNLMNMEKFMQRYL